jgi:peptidoglycan/LPS O-acetylase OafA/YrhL
MKLPKVIWQFDLLRGLAVLAVMLFHMGNNWRSAILPRYTTWGWTGVDLFFVLSGFLITGILLETKADPAYFQNFYARRILRIWPLYFTLLVVFMLVLPWVSPRLAAPSVTTAYPRWAYLLFVQNFFRQHKVLGPLSVTWSLAVEEQYYIVWPLMVFLLSVKRLKLLLLVLVLAGPIAALITTRSGNQFDFTPFHIDGLAIGSLLAIFVRNSVASAIRKIGLGALVGSAVGIALQLGTHSTWPQFFLLSVAFGSVLCLAITTTFIRRNRFLCYTGKISYGLYLLHLPSFDLVRSDRVRTVLPHGPLANDLSYTAIAFATAYAAATASWFCIEKPILRLKERFSRSGNAKSAYAGRTAPSQIVSLDPFLWIDGLIHGNSRWCAAKLKRRASRLFGQCLMNRSAKKAAIASATDAAPLKSATVSSTPGHTNR